MIDIMRAQRIGDALLRTKSSPILAFLAPSIPLSAWAPLRGNVASHLGSSQSQGHLRCLATKTSPLNASSATAAKEENDEAVPQLSMESDRSAASRTLLNGLVGEVLTSNSKFTGKNASPASPPKRTNPEQPTSAEIFKRALNQGARSRAYLNEKQGQIASRLNWGDTSKTAFEDFGLEDTFKNMSVSQQVNPPPAPVRLDAFIGRSEEVDPMKGVDLARALRKLEIKCAYNNVRQDFNKQRFHERPGIKRKRLKSQRWRKRFKEGFKAVVSKVQHMRMRGW